MSAITKMVNKAQISTGVPTGKIEQDAEQGHDGEFFSGQWLIKVNSELFNKALPDDIAEELAATLYHEIRHSEQYFRIAQKEALKFNDNGKSKNSAQITLETGIDERITKQAIASVQNLNPEQKKQLLKELAITDPWYRSIYPKTPAEAEANNKLRNTLNSKYELVVAAQNKYDFARNHTRQFSWSQINKLETVTTEAKKQYETARTAYIGGLDEEADADATEQKFRVAYKKELTLSRQRKPQNVKPATGRNKSEEDWTDKFYNRGTHQQLSTSSSQLAHTQTANSDQISSSITLESVTVPIKEVKTAHLSGSTGDQNGNAVADSPYQNTSNAQKTDATDVSKVVSLLKDNAAEVKKQYGLDVNTDHGLGKAVMQYWQENNLDFKTLKKQLPDMTDSEFETASKALAKTNVTETASTKQSERQR